LEHNVTKSDQETLRVRMNLPRLFGSTCQHEKVVMVRSAGMARIVCESCGHVSFSFDRDDLDPVIVDLADLASSGADTH
jgi:transcription elongation factor Elf1